MQEKNYIKKPDWLRIKVTGDKNNDEIENMLKDLKLNTVCKEANCPNKMECYKSRTATFMILGENCTRNCKYCNVTTKKPEEVDPHEPENLAKAVKILGLRHAVITSVTRDDLADEGATQFRDVIRWVRKLNPETTVEVLIPDMHAKKDLLDIVMDEKPDILNHNIETIERLFPEVRKEGNFKNSIEVIKYAKEKGLKTKSGFMVGLGETKEEVLALIKELYEAGCDYITIGQYLRPSLKHYEVKRYVHPDEFKEYEEYAKSIGIKKIAAGPFVRSSYKAADMVDKNK